MTDDEERFQRETPDDAEAMAKALVSALLEGSGPVGDGPAAVLLRSIATDLQADLSPDPVEAARELEQRGIKATTIVGVVAQIAAGVIRLAEAGQFDSETVRADLRSPYTLPELDIG